MTPRPLISLPRYEVVLFPLFMWGAWWIDAPPVDRPGVASMAVLLGLVHRRVRDLAVRGLSAASAPRAVLLDALGTLVELEPPAPRLREELAARFGVRVSLAAAARCDRGRDLLLPRAPG